jgi:hypothetical protein
MGRRRIPQKRFDPLSEEMESLVLLCRRGDLFGVQKWIEAGRPIQPGPGKFRRTPLRVAIETGFLSLVEVLLRAGIDDAEKARALRKAMDVGRADIFDLLVRYGADHSVFGVEEIMKSRQKELIEWYAQRGVDWESGYPIAHALARGQREFLGVYMSLRDSVPSARMQATMALREHCNHGRMRWIALLLWAGADPNLVVPDLDYPEDEECSGTALGAAVHHGNFEIVSKIGIDPSRTNVSELLASVWLLTDTRLVEMLLAMGADPNAETESGNAMDSLIGSLAWALDGLFRERASVEAALKSIELAAAHGGRCRFSDRGNLSVLRRSLGKKPREEVVALLQRLANCGAVEPKDMRRLLSTPGMKFAVSGESPAAEKLRKYAGFRARKKSDESL